MRAMVRRIAVILGRLAVLAVLAQAGAAAAATGADEAGAHAEPAAPAQETAAVEPHAGTEAHGEGHEVPPADDHAAPAHDQPAVDDHAGDHGVEPAADHAADPHAAEAAAVEPTHAAEPVGPAPAEAPPGDFPGAQYIDSTGCVFLRQGEAWVARIGPDDQPVCGYPPSVSARRKDPETLSVLSPAVPEKKPGIEEQLMSALAHGLRDGELDGSFRPREEVAPNKPVEAPTEGPIAELNGMLHAAPVLRAEMSGGLSPNGRLCDLLGYSGKETRLPALGSDPTQGFCAGLSAPDLSPVIAEGEAAAPGEPTHAEPTQLAAADPHADPHADSHAAPVADAHSAPEPQQAKADHPAPAAPAGHGDAESTSAPADHAAPAPAPRPAPAEPRRTARAPQATGEIGLEMIPASARYVLVGQYPGAARAQAVIGQIAALGYPVSRGQVKGDPEAAALIMAGPFPDRRSVVAALNDLRRRGYAGAVAR